MMTADATGYSQVALVTQGFDAYIVMGTLTAFVISIHHLSPDMQSGAVFAVSAACLPFFHKMI